MFRRQQHKQADIPQLGNRNEGTLHLSGLFRTGMHRETNPPWKKQTPGPECQCGHAPRLTSPKSRASQPWCQRCLRARGLRWWLAKHSPKVTSLLTANSEQSYPTTAVCSRPQAFFCYSGIFLYHMVGEKKFLNQLVNAERHLAFSPARSQFWKLLRKSALSSKPINSLLLHHIQQNSRWTPAC